MQTGACRGVVEGQGWQQSSGVQDLARTEKPPSSCPYLQCSLAPLTSQACGSCMHPNQACLGMS